MVELITRDVRGQLLCKWHFRRVHAMILCNCLTQRLHESHSHVMSCGGKCCRQMASWAQITDITTFQRHYQLREARVPLASPLFHHGLPIICDGQKHNSCCSIFCPSHVMTWFSGSWWQSKTYSSGKQVFLLLPHFVSWRACYPCRFGPETRVFPKLSASFTL